MFFLHFKPFSLEIYRTYRFLVSTRRLSVMHTVRPDRNKSQHFYFTQTATRCHTQQHHHHTLPYPSKNMKLWFFVSFGVWNKSCTGVLPPPPHWKNILWGCVSFAFRRKVGKSVPRPPSDLLGRLFCTPVAYRLIPFFGKNAGLDNKSLAKHKSNYVLKSVLRKKKYVHRSFFWDKSWSQIHRVMSF